MTTITVERNYDSKIIWPNVIIYLSIHCLALYEALQIILFDYDLLSFVWLSILAFLSAFGTLCGAHRLWSHRSYKAKWPLRALLMILQTITLTGPIFNFSRDHRVHHLYSETDADPYNSKRGFFFAHMGI